MNSWRLDKRVGALSEKLKSGSSDVIRVDLDSFTEPEKQLFRRIWEIEEEYGSSPPADIIEANKEFIFKASEVFSWRVLELFVFVMREVLGSDGIEEWFFKLHFYNFFEDLSECLKNVRRWSDGDREEFLHGMKENGMMDKVFRIPRGSNTSGLVEDESKQEGKGDD